MPTPAFTPTATRTPSSAAAITMVDLTLTAAVTTAPTEAPTDPPSEPTAPSTQEGPTPTVDPALPTLTPTATAPPPTLDDGLPPDHYVVGRPIPTGWTDYGDRTYAYGATAGGKYRPHTGMEFWNPLSTPVIAVANATIEHSGTDWELLFGPELSFYGNLIVLRLNDYTYNGQSVYALYGHLSEMYFNTGDVVPTGEIIGAVGGTGAANGGPHLHFEIRVGDPRDYFHSTRNPDLWIKPYFGYGTLAGRVVTPDGSMLPNVSITVRGADAVRYTWTYAGSENIPDPEWHENFTLGDLPEGWYTITTRSSKKSFSEEVYIRAGRTSFLEMVFE
jgi:murein DD-endopeptidase MepM/ murein hydrolase activator NlpD